MSYSPAITGISTICSIDNGPIVYKTAPSFLRSGVRGFIDQSSILSADLRRKLQHTFLGRDATVESLQLDNFYGAFSASERETMLGSGRYKAASSYGAYLNYWNSRSGSTLSQMLFADQKTYLVELLMKQDQMSMACSIESRVPFLDHTFVEFASRVPDNLKIRNKSGKYIMKKAVEDLLPHDIIYRTKMGFPTPLRQWFRDEQNAPIYSVLLDRNSFLSEYVDLKYVEDLIARQRNGTDDATDRLWRLLNLQVWGEGAFAGHQERYWDGLLTSPLAREIA